MGKQYRLALIAATISMLCSGEHRITFFVQTYPALNQAVDSEDLLEKTVNPQQAMSSILHANPQSQPFSGLMATYAGHVTASGPFNGQVSFPRKQQNPFFYYVVTPRITPIMMLGATVHHWELVEGMPVEFYAVDRKQDPDTQRYFWSTRKVDAPESNIVPLSSIVMFAEPRTLYIPTGITPTHDSPQLLLPTVYVRNGIDLAESALSLLNVKHFFRAIRTKYKKGATKSWISQIEG